jgi:sulfite exporter TauE/SafE
MAQTGVPVAAVAPLSGNVDLLLYVAIGVLGGAHCLGMCGPLVSTYADRISDRSDRREARLTVYDVRQHALFNLGRTAGYALVGAVLGLVGGAAIGAAAIGPVASVVRGGVGVVVGSAIVVIGLGYLRTGTTTGTLSVLPGLDAAVGRFTGLLAGRVDRLANSPGIAGLGALHALLPCPILYPAYLYALALGDPFRGAVALGLLGLGTVLTLLPYGLAFGSLSVARRRSLHRVMGVVFVALGYLPLAHGLMLFGVDLPYPDVPFYQPLR